MVDTESFENGDAGFQQFKLIKSQSKLPVCSGTSAEVLKILKARVGRKPLTIEAIAEDINLSKRTLQRRLQQEMISFASLRDQVRFHKAIDCLMKLNMSIEDTSRFLDFSDRTSFTNAFKRWTKISPSTFRRRYSGYE